MAGVKSGFDSNTYNVVVTLRIDKQYDRIPEAGRLDARDGQDAVASRSRLLSEGSYREN